MKDIYQTRFSKIGTNPMKYFRNYEAHINEQNVGDILVLKDYKVLYNDYPLIKFKSDATFRQNIDTWIWMGFCTRRDKDKLIKIVPKLDTKSLLEISKMSLLIESNEELVNIHRNTVLIKLLSLEKKKSLHNKTTYEEIKKECGEYERIVISDLKYIELIKFIWGK